MLQGIVAPTVTIFRDDGALDAEANRAHADFLIESGVHGLHVLGIVGEFMHMNLKEREQHATDICQHVGGRVPVIIGTGTPSTRETMRLSRHAQGVGASAVSIITPYFWNLTERELIAHYSAVANAVDIPILINNAPAFSGINMQAETLAALAREHSNITGVVDTVESIEHLRHRIAVMKTVNPEFRVLTGLDVQAFTVLEMGGDGVLPATSNVMPEQYVAVYDAWQRGDFERVYAYLPRIMAGCDMLRVSGNVLSTLKEAMTACGIAAAGTPRQPVMPLTAESRARLRETLARAELLNDSGSD